MRIAFFIMGWFATALGALGAFLPLLPTTPFLLLAATCFARSSPRTREWLLNAPHLGPALRNYLEHRVVPTRAKAFALLLLWPGVGWTATRVVPVPAVGVALVLLALCVSAYLLLLPTRLRDEASVIGRAAVPVRQRAGARSRAGRIAAGCGS